MGTGIANLAAINGFDVILRDIADHYLENSLKRMNSFMEKSVKSNKMTEEKKTAVLNRLKTTTNLDDIKDVDFVIEAVTEDMDLKKELFKQLDEFVKEEAILATN